VRSHLDAALNDGRKANDLPQMQISLLGQTTKDTISQGRGKGEGELVMEADDEPEGANYDEAVPTWYADGAYCRVRPDVSSLVFYQSVPNATVNKIGKSQREKDKAIVDIRIPTSDLFGVLYQFLYAVGVLSGFGVRFDGFSVKRNEPKPDDETEMETIQKQFPTKNVWQHLRQKGVWVGGPEWSSIGGRKISYTITIEGEDNGKHDPMQ